MAAQKRGGIVLVDIGEDDADDRGDADEKAADIEDVDQIDGVLLARIDGKAVV